jgi:hypothetical protein
MRCTVDLHFDVLDEALLTKAVARIDAETLGNCGDDLSTEAKVAFVVTHIDVLALAYNKAIGWLDVGLERVGN